MNLLLFLTLILSVALPIVSSEGDGNSKHVICYYGTWATYRPGEGKFDPEDVDTSLCTHLIYAFVGITADGNVISLDPELDLPDNNGRDYFGKFNALKEKNPNLKTVLAVGGWNEGSANYSIMAGNETYRRTFISSALNMVQTHGFDGFDVDWEYPNRRDTVYGEQDIDNFTQLLKELKEEFGKYGLIISAAVSAVEKAVVQSYDVPAICEYLDIVNIMTYDLYGSWNDYTGHNAALHKGAAEEVYTVDGAIEYWLSQGCPPEKVVMGLPMYGKTYTLTDPDQNGVGASASGPGIPGPFTGEAGNIGYNELCVQLKNDSVVVHYDSLAKVPYAVEGSNWISFDDPNSLTEKINWGLKRNIAGVMLWSIETDDFHGNCGEKYPLLNAINSAIQNFKPEE